MGNKGSAEYDRMKAVALPCYLYDAGYSGIVHCDGRCEQQGTVWGSGPYTADSCICRAARHAGVLPEKGEGVFKVTVVQGQPSYEGSTAHGITSVNFGSYETGITLSAMTQ